MLWLRSRVRRVRRFSRVVVGLILTSVAIVTAVAYWVSRLGYLGVVVVAGLILIALVTVVVLPEPAWMRLMGADALQLDALARRLNGATSMRHSWFQEKPPASQMKSELVAWYEETRMCVEEIGPSYMAELQAAMLTSTRHVDYVGSGLDADQQGVVRRLDALIECVRAMLRQLGVRGS